MKRAASLAPTVAARNQVLDVLVALQVAVVVVISKNKQRTSEAKALGSPHPWGVAACRAGRRTRWQINMWTACVRMPVWTQTWLCVCKSSN